MMLTIEEAIRRVPSWGTASSVKITALPGGSTNRNYRVDVDGDAFVVRIWARGTELLGIDRDREHRCALIASRTGVAPEVLYFLPDDGITVTRFVEGRRLSREEAAGAESLRRIVQSIHRLHAGPAFEGSFSPFQAIEEYLQVARGYKARLPQDVGAMHRRIREIGAALHPGRAIVRPCHNDLWWENFIDDGTQVHIVDWEYAAMGDACFDLAYFAMHHSPSSTQDETLLRAYFGQVPEEARTRFRLLKIVAELREALWYLVAINVSSSSTGFGESARTHFDRCRQTLADPRVPGWIDQAAHG